MIPKISLAAAAIAASFAAPAVGQTSMLPAPGFHHLHLNSVDPEAAIAFYTRYFPVTSKTAWGGFPALKSPNDVLVLFSKVDKAPATAPQTAYWHFGWHMTDLRKRVAELKAQPEIKFLPLFTSDEGGSVLVSSDTFPGTGGVLGLTKAQLAQARANGVKPRGGGGFSYIQGPDGAMIELQGNRPAERMNHVHMYQNDVFCAQLWYRKHLNARVPPERMPKTEYTEANCKVARGPDPSWPSTELQGTYRVPTTGVEFGDVSMNWYANQGEMPLAPTRGQLYDHVGLSVSDLDAWVAKLRGEGVTFLQQPYKLGDTRAVMIEGPSREALELVEVK